MRFPIRFQLAVLAVVILLAASPVTAQDDRPGDPDHTAFDQGGAVTFRSLSSTDGHTTRPGDPVTAVRFHLGFVRIPNRSGEVVAEPGRLCEQWAWSSGGTPSIVSASRSCYQANMPVGCVEADGYELAHYMDSWNLIVGAAVVLYTEQVYEWDLYCKGRFIHP